MFNKRLCQAEASAGSGFGRLRLRQAQADRSPCHFELDEKLPKPYWRRVSEKYSLRHAQADMVFRDALKL